MRTDNKQPQDRLMPSAADIEDAVLGALLLETQSVYTATSLLKPDCFYKKENILVFGAISYLVTEGSPIDILTVTHKLRTDGTLADAGGPLYVSQLTNRVSSTANLETWIAILNQFAIKRRMIVLCQGTIEKLHEDMEDVFEVCEAHGDGYVDVGHVDPDKLSLSASHRASEGLNRLVEAVRTGIKPGISVGLDVIDKAIGGFQTGLYVIASRPGCGKSEMAMFISHQVASQGIPVYFCQCEMSDEQSINREFSRHTGIPYSRLEKANVSAEELDTVSGLVEKFKSVPVHMDHAPGITLNKLISKIKFHWKRNKIKMVVIDYLQIMDIRVQKGETRDAAIGNVTRRLKQTANQLKIPVILLAQLSRATDQRRPFPIPQQSDLRESGNIENDADAIMFHYYPGKYKNLYQKGFEDENGTPLDGLLLCIWDKNRYGRPGIADYCRWDSGKVSFRNLHDNIPIDFPHPDTFTQSQKDGPF